MSKISLISAVGCLICILLSMIGCRDKVEFQAEVKSFMGKVEYRHAGGNFQIAEKGQKLFDKDAVRTGEESNLTITFAKGGKLKLFSNSFFEVKKGDLLGKQGLGSGIYAIDKQNNTLKIEVPQGLTTILGTTFRQDISSDSAIIYLKEGSIKFSNSSGAVVVLKEGEKLVIPSEVRILKPEKINEFDVDTLFKDDKTLTSF